MWSNNPCELRSIHERSELPARSERPPPWSRSSVCLRQERSISESSHDIQSLKWPIIEITRKTIFPCSHPKALLSWPSDHLLTHPANLKLGLSTPGTCMSSLRIVESHL